MLGEEVGREGAEWECARPRCCVVQQYGRARTVDGGPCLSLLLVILLARICPDKTVLASLVERRWTDAQAALGCSQCWLPSQRRKEKDIMRVRTFPGRQRVATSFPRLLIVALVLAVTFLVGGVPAAHAAPLASTRDGVYPLNGVGYDISWPQCAGAGTKTLPTLNASNGFVILGVNGGSAFTANPCFASEDRWARGSGVTVSYYMNLNAPTGGSGYSGPAGTCAGGDANCIAYNYGYSAAAYAMQRAGGSSGYGGPGYGGPGYGGGAQMWWLDIETGNHWSSQTVNDYTIEGAVDYIRSQGAQAGIYCTRYQWSIIAGSGFQPGTLGLPSGGYSRGFFGAPVTANWDAAQYTCSGAPLFPHGILWVAQNGYGTYDHDAICF